MYFSNSFAVPYVVSEMHPSAPAPVVRIRITVAPVGVVSLPEAKRSSRTGRTGKKKQPLALGNAPSHANPRLCDPSDVRREIQLDFQQGGRNHWPRPQSAHLKGRRAAVLTSMHRREAPHDISVLVEGVHPFVGFFSRLVSPQRVKHGPDYQEHSQTPYIFCCKRLVALCTVCARWQSEHPTSAKLNSPQPTRANTFCDDDEGSDMRGAVPRYGGLEHAGAGTRTELHARPRWPVQIGMLRAYTDDGR
jgi:hypothetical protein